MNYLRRYNPYKWWNLVFFVGVIIVNVLAVTLPLGGNSTGEISDKYKTYMTPAGYAFSIWSLIYLLLAVSLFINSAPIQALGILYELFRSGLS